MSTKFIENRNLYHTFSRIAIQEGQVVAAAVNKTGHTVTTNDVWSDIDKLPKNTTYVPNAGKAFTDLKTVYDANASEYSKYVKLYENAVLSPVADCAQDPDKNQTWELLVDGKRVNNFIAPTDVVDADGKPCNGYTLKLFDKGGTQIPATDGNWAFDYIAGLVIFERGKTPEDMGWATTTNGTTTAPIKITAWAYVGDKLQDSLTAIQADIAAVEALGSAVIPLTGTVVSGVTTIAPVVVGDMEITGTISANGDVNLVVPTEVLTVKETQKNSTPEIIYPELSYVGGKTTLVADYGDTSSVPSSWQIMFKA